jgi:hypothetical protein
VKKGGWSITDVLREMTKDTLLSPQREMIIDTSRSLTRLKAEGVTAQVDARLFLAILSLC